MTPAIFPEVNKVFGPPESYEESQVQKIPAFLGTVERGSCEGETQVVVAYDLSPEDLRALIENGGRIFLSCLGGLPPHFLAFSFADCRNIP